MEKSQKAVKQDWDIIITPEKKWFDIQLERIWNYRDLLFLFVKRDVIAFYKQTIFGPLWFFIQPLFTTVIFTFVFGSLANLSTDGLPQPLFYLIGITSWTYFADCLTKTSTVFRDNQMIFGKVYFPRVISALSIVISNLVRFGVQLLLVGIVMIYFLSQGITLEIGPEIFLFPVFILLIASQGLGIGMLVSSLTTKYRDLSYLVGFGVQLLMYGTTVVYPLSTLQGKLYWLIALNPVTFIIEGMRKSLTGSGYLTVESISYSIMISTLILLFGYLAFNKVERSFVDTI